MSNSHLQVNNVSPCESSCHLLGGDGEQELPGGAQPCQARGASARGPKGQGMDSSSSESRCSRATSWRYFPNKP